MTVRSKYGYYWKCLCLACLFLFTVSASKAIEIKGKITDEKTNEVLVGVHIIVVGQVYGTISNYKGEFVLSTSKLPPLELKFSYMGYESKVVSIGEEDTLVHVKMKEQYLLGQEVVVSASRVEESILRSPISIEKMNLRDLKQVSAANFYDGLYQLKGVDMNVHGLTFRLPNARGFNDYSNYRMNQIIDGMENIAPGLSFAAGNIFGLSQIDVESVELVIGASTALYGPGGMNGTLVMKSKDPFRHQGLTVSVQAGAMNIGSEVLESATPLYDINLRYARSFSNRMAIKLTGAYLTATDWPAADFRDRSDLDNKNLNRFTNPGYDGVNTYGDESLVSLNLLEVGPQVIDGIAESQGIQPGTPEYQELFDRAMPYFPDQLVTRTGWAERALADDKTENIRVGGALHYFINDLTESIIHANYAQGSSVYTAQNRFAARDFYILSGKLEVNNPNYYIRAWGVSENSGSSYDIGGAALQLNEDWKGSEIWFEDYLTAYTQTVLVNENMQEAHEFARLVADNRDPISGNVFDATKPAIPLPDTEDFDQRMNRITGISVADGGAMVFDKSKIFQVEGMYNFSHLIPFMEMQLGASYRLYSINSNGTVFFDKPGQPIKINQLGTFLQLNKNLLRDRLRLTGAFRYDKNENFEAQYTPRFSFMYFLDKDLEHSLRTTFQTAYRFPAISNQWVDIDVGIFRTIGGMAEVHEHYNFNTIPLYPMSGRNPVKDKPITEFGPITLPGLEPEKVLSTELGYKGLFLKKKLFLDSYVYYNKYKGFEAVQLVAQLAEDAGTDKDLLFQTNFTTDEPVSSFGWAVGLDYMTPFGMLIRSNVAYNKLLENIEAPGVEARYNTPEYRTNISVGHHGILPNLGFNVNFHWQSAFTWEAGFGKGEIPAYTTLDAHVSYKVPAIKTTFKLGGSNLLNDYYITSFGSAQIGGLYYLSLVYEDILGYMDRKRE